MWLDNRAEHDHARALVLAELNAVKAIAVAEIQAAKAETGAMETLIGELKLLLAETRRPWWRAVAGLG